MSVLFGLFYTPLTKTWTVKNTKKKHVEIVLEFTSQMFIFQDFDTWFNQKKTKLLEVWKNWSG